MNKLLTSEKIYIAKSKIADAGRGVYAKSNIKKGEIIESSPIIEVPQHDMSNIKESILVTYFFFFGKNKKRLALALGFGSIYNHSYEAPRPHSRGFFSLASSGAKSLRSRIHSHSSASSHTRFSAKGDKPNITYKINSKKKLIDFIALEDISKDTELTFNYRSSGNSKSKKRPLWFEKEED